MSSNLFYHVLMGWRAVFGSTALDLHNLYLYLERLPKSLRASF